ncbi:Malonyl-CoA:anthocyanidin 5-O-glucoside-6''-O-malonyltransferase [Linum grandiflorum]
MSTIRVIEIYHVAPSPLPASDFSSPLTFFDSFFLKFDPVEYIYFYELPATSPSDVIIPRLKHSLSLALAHFLPLAGKLTWPENSDVPFILYTPTDGVSLTIAESTEDFNVLSGDGPREASLSRAYVPKLHVSVSDAAVLALQVTVFPRHRGFSVGVTYHHAVLDGKSAAMFMKAWAHFSMELGNGGDGGELTESLTPFLDRTVVKDPDGIALEDFKTWMAVNKTNNNVLCIAKAKKEAFDNDDKLVQVAFAADCRSRMDPPLPSNYFGSSVVIVVAPDMKTGDLVRHGGIARPGAKKEEVLMRVDVAGSPRLGVYDVDFGFGRPEKVEITSVDRGSGMSMVESGDGSGGVEVGVVMLRHEMDKFASSFVDGLTET